MAKKLFVGNLAWAVTSEKLQELFAPFGKVISAVVVTQPGTTRSRGFGFVEFDDDAAAAAAVKEMNGKNIEGREVVVNEARPPMPRGERTGGGSFRRNNYRDNDRGGMDMAA